MPQTDWSSLHGTHFRGTRVLVTGGAGFIGSHLAQALTALGVHVTVLDDLSGGSLDNLHDFSPPAAPLPNLEFVQGSILDRALLQKVTAGARYVFHLAALGSVPRSVEEPRLYHDVNITGTLNVLEAAREIATSGHAVRVIFAASSSAYGTNPVPWIETMPTLPQSPYAATKVADESLLRAYAGSYGSAHFDTVSLRYFNIFGPRQNANSAYAAVIAAFAKALLAGERPVIYGDGEQTRDFTYVDNAVHANLFAARLDQPLRGTVLNVGTGTPISVNTLAAMMASMLSRPDLKPRHAPERTGDLRHSFANLTAIKQTLAYAPLVAFQEGLEQVADWYRRHW